jgi:pimeloyl-ACP methyl ester carboxylesterase
VAEDLRGDYRVLAPDLRGHGGGSYYQTQLTGLTIIAHSLGGSIALLCDLFTPHVRAFLGA